MAASSVVTLSVSRVSEDRASRRDDGSALEAYDGIVKVVLWGNGVGSEGAGCEWCH
jgi:hypothetical protein